MHLIKLLQRWPQRKEKSLHHYYHHHRCRQWVLCDSVTGPQMPSLSRVALLAHKQLKDIWPLIPAVWWSEYSLASLLNAGFVQLTSEWYKIGLSFISSRNPLNFEQVICLFVCFLFCFNLGPPWKLHASFLCHHYFPSQTGIYTSNTQLRSEAKLKNNLSKLTKQN